MSEALTIDRAPSMTSNGGGAAVSAAPQVPDLGETESQGEAFIPVTRYALLDRLTQPNAWPAGMAGEARRFLRYLAHWRAQQYGARILELEQIYEPFSPDSDLLITRTFSDAERASMQRRAVDGVQQLLTNANYTRIPASQLNVILTKDSHYGLDLHVDLDAFDELLIFYRGASSQTHSKRVWRKFYRKQEFKVPIYRRLVVLFKLKTFETRVVERMQKERISRADAERAVRKLNALLPPQIKRENIYIKMFKNIPRSDLEMIFPNTQVKFRLLDKIKLGVTGSAGLGMGAVGAAGKLAVAFSNPITAAGAVAGLGGVVFRQAMNFVNTRQRYMVVMAQNLYFHAMADNRAAIIKLADRAAEEDFKEEMLLYCVLAKERVRRQDLAAVDRAIEKYLATTFGLTTNFDVSDALSRLIAEGIVTEAGDGTLMTLPPRQAGLLIDHKWDKFLDELPDIRDEGTEMTSAADSAGPSTA